ncbi:MAG: efflux RND transporter periplasmic adaptor subunit, partial [Zoogloea sp.]|nr:efflux RND transporter periplasmic adaptor subunit [Zoogloea sp.]
MKRPLLIALIAAVIAGGTWYTQRPAAPDKPEEPAIQRPSAEPGVLRFPTAAPQLAQLKVERTEIAPVPMDEPLAARVAYDENATARVFAPIAGRVVEIRANVGDAVKAGEVLAVLDAPELGTAAADLAKAQADARQKQSALARARSLFEAEVIARRDLETAEAESRQAQAEAERARLRLANLAPGGKADSGSQHYALRTPIAGIVATRQINPGMEIRTDRDEP